MAFRFQGNMFADLMNEEAVNSFTSLNDILAGAILLIDKPVDWTSFDVVNKIKLHLRRGHSAPKFKIGHAGTLDPLATGLLVVCTGAFTKKIDHIQIGEKEYSGTIFFGKTTPSFDLETEPEGDYSTIHLTEDLIRKTAESFVGEQLQTPPKFSAKWINGKRAYMSARLGEEIEMRQVLITVQSFEVTRIELPEVDFVIRCSKGTYIRSLANDFGKRLESGSYLKLLRRTASNPFTVREAMTMEELFVRIDAMDASLKS